MQLPVDNPRFKRRFVKHVLEEEFLGDVRRPQFPQEAPCMPILQHKFRRITRQADIEQPLIRHGELSSDMQQILPAVKAPDPVLRPIGGITIIEQVHEVIMLIAMGKLGVIRRF